MDRHARLLDVGLAFLSAVLSFFSARRHPSRFRPNIVVAGVPAWDEFGWVGGTVRIGGVTLRVLKRTVRCDATKVDPRFGNRGLGFDSEPDSEGFYPFMPPPARNVGCDPFDFICL